MRNVIAQGVAAGVVPGAVAAAAIGGNELETVAIGDAVQADENGLLPVERRQAVTVGTVFDLASLTKVFTAVGLLTLVDDGLLRLDEPVAGWLPEFRKSSKDRITLRQLLAHTSGLQPAWRGWRQYLVSGFDRDTLISDLLAIGPEAPPGTRYVYSCVGYLVAMALAERVTGQGWDQLFTDRVLSPLSLDGVTFGADPALCAATEYQPDLGRGMVCGVVHDEAAWSLGGISGNAGLFGTAGDVLRFAESLRMGLPGLLSRATCEELWRDQLPVVLDSSRVEPAYLPNFGQAIGMRIGQRAWMSQSGRNARGHTGFTGTSMLVDREHDVSVVLLTNRIHPSRATPPLHPLRAAVAAEVYRLAG
ncbi:serine hydrolase domain-containing protein [Saxibacter everestensis]|uniref:Serine hydrolase domain-containing protein n=1 Tax=Saxibacter everestensis TaxID=2909229 RepID=A0ABY8QQD9_9MICO|nr:serine hydrolase domain-containing protein [Brevibacteriaceae bacterium ZFBP1038]